MITFDLNPEEHKQLLRMAEAEGVSVSDYVRRLVVKALNEEPVLTAAVDAPGRPDEPEPKPQKHNSMWSDLGI